MISADLIQLQSPRRPQRGGFLVTFLLVVPVLLGALGFAFSVTDAAIARTHLQAAADACALSGAHRATMASATAANIVSTAQSVGALTTVGLLRRTSQSRAFQITAASNFASANTADTFVVSCSASYQDYLATWLKSASGATLSMDIAAEAKAGFTVRNNCWMPLAMCKASGLAVGDVLSNGSQNPTESGGNGNGNGNGNNAGSSSSSTSGWVWTQVPGLAGGQPSKYFENPFRGSKLVGQCRSGTDISTSGSGDFKVQLFGGQVLNNSSRKADWDAMDDDPKTRYEVVPMVTCGTGTGGIANNASNINITQTDRACVEFAGSTGSGSANYSFRLKYLGPAGSTPQCADALINADRSGSVTVGIIKSGGFTPLYPARLMQ